MRGFEAIAQEYDKGRRSETVEFWADETAKVANLHEDSLVLDLGCGTGIYTIRIGLETAASMCGLDPASTMLAQARKKSKTISWINAVGEWIPIRANVFDCIFSSQVWHHIANKQKTANECFRVLKPEGTVVIRTISHEQLRRKVIFEYFPEILAHQLEVYPSKDDFNRYFRNAGFYSTEHLSYNLERYQQSSELIEIAEKRLWSMFRNITREGLSQGIEKLRRYEKEHAGQPIRNDETITLVVARKPS